MNLLKIIKRLFAKDEEELPLIQRMNDCNKWSSLCDMWYEYREDLQSYTQKEREQIFNIFTQKLKTINDPK